VRIGLRKNIKVVLITFIVVLITVTSLLLSKEIKKPRFKEENATLYSYTNKSMVNYEVFMLPNMLYDSEKIEEGKMYVSKYINQITSAFSYEFSGEEKTKLIGDYQIIGQMQGFVLDGEEEQIVWTKDVITLPSKSFDIEDNNILLKEDISINFQHYDNFIKLFVEESKISTNTRLTITMNVNLFSDTDKGNISETLSSSLVIPLNESYFAIEKKGIGEDTKTLEGMKTVEVPLNKRIVATYSVILLCLIISLLYLVRSTDTVEQDVLLKELNKIFKSHGSRLVALSNHIESSNDNLYEVNSMEDLVKIADEIEKPILYKYCTDIKSISRFYVLDTLSTYIFEVHKLVEEEGEIKEDVEAK